MIDRRELLAVARERRLPLGMIEKDYVLGWVLYGMGQIEQLALKGGSALAKVYFPAVWRLSEDLDFVTLAGGWEQGAARVPEAVARAAVASGLGLTIKSDHRQPGYVQFKVQYTGPLGRNWLKIDITPEAPVGGTTLEPLSRTFSDYPAFRVRVERLEEILAQKLRALVERKKVRDYYDVWKMTDLTVNRVEVSTLFRAKLDVKGLAWCDLGDFFPANLEEVLAGYWDKELGRLVRPVPDMHTVLSELRGKLDWVEDT